MIPDDFFVSMLLVLVWVDPGREVRWQSLRIISLLYSLTINS